MTETKLNVLIVGTGGVGTLAAYALEIGGKADVTAVMRSNYDAVMKRGVSIDSCQYGQIDGWRPTTIRKTIPDVAEESLQPFDYVLVTTKNVADVPPSVADLIAPAVTPEKTCIVLSQNGLNIEKPLVPRFPTNPIISSISFIGVVQRSQGDFWHKHYDIQLLGAFNHATVPQAVGEAAAQRYIAAYTAGGKAQATHEPDVAKTRWRKLVYNASFNSVSAVLRMDTMRMRMSQHVIDELVRPIMLEIMAGAKAAGVELEKGLHERFIRIDPKNGYFKPSMCQDVERGNLMEFENIVGEPMRECEAMEVPVPTLRTVYGMLKGLQLQIKEAKGLWAPLFEPENPYQ